MRQNEKIQVISPKTDESWGEASEEDRSVIEGKLPELGGRPQEDIEFSFVGREFLCPDFCPEPE